MVIKRIRYLMSRVLQMLFNPKAVYHSTFGKHSSVGKGCQIVNCTVGNYSYITSNCAIVNTQIGSFCSIATGAMIGGGNHPVDWVSTSPVFHNGKNACNYHFSEKTFEPYKKTIIGNDVWIGAHVLIQGGLTIGDGSVVGMGSVVTHDVPPYTIVAGNPARVIRKRFSDDAINQLMKLEWWNLKEEDIARASEYIDNVEEFINKVNSIVEDK